MTLRTRMWLGAIAGVFALTAPGSAQVTLVPGEYAMTADMDFAGKKMSSKNTECLTAEDVKKGFLGAFIEADEEKNCKILSSTWAGPRLTVTMSCEVDGLKMTSTSEMTFTTESFKGVMTTKDSDGRTTIIATTGKRTGPCKK